MSIEKKCCNCQNMWCDKNTALFCEDDNSYSDFIPKEELVRADERAKIRDKIINDYSYYNSMYKYNIKNEEIRKIYEPISHLLLEYIRFLNDLDFGREQ